MDSDRLEALLARVDASLSAREEQHLEIDARLSAQRFLLEQFLANAFIGDPDGFEAFAEAALQRTRLASTVPEPMPAEEREERTVRIATHVARIAASVSRRLRSDLDGG